jgi:hypothetical protein
MLFQMGKEVGRELILESIKDEQQMQIRDSRGNYYPQFV